MKKYLFFVLIFLTTHAARAQTDSLFVVPMVDGWMLMEKVSAGENVSVLARRFFVPPAILASANAKNPDEPLQTGSTLFVPLAAYNLTRRLPAKGQVDVRPLYYQVENANEKLLRIARAGGIGERDLREWNNLSNSDLVKGQTLLVGGLRYDATGTFKKKTTQPESAFTGRPETESRTDPKNPPIKKGAVAGLEDFIHRTDAILHSEGRADSSIVTSLPADTAGVDTLLNEDPSEPKKRFRRSTEAQAFEALEAAGVGFVEEKGTAVFFPSRSSTTIYAFHNIAGKGSVIKITNPLNGRAVYAKVLGPLPPTPQYHKAMLGISAMAQKLLGSTGDTRMWCEVAFVGY